MDTLGHLPALKVTAASDGDREQVAALAEGAQQFTGSAVEIMCIDQGYMGARVAEATQQNGSQLSVVRHRIAKRSFFLLPR